MVFLGDSYTASQIQTTSVVVGRWNGSKRRDGREFSIVAAGAGLHTVTARAYDDTPSVRLANNERRLIGPLGRTSAGLAPLPRASP